MKKRDERFVKEWGDLLRRDKYRFIFLHSTGMAIILFIGFLLLAYFTEELESSLKNILAFAILSYVAALGYGLFMYWVCKRYLGKIKD